MVAEGDLLTSLADTSEVFVYFRVSEQEYLQYTSKKDEGLAKDVSFKLANGELLSGAGVIDASESEIDRSTGTLALRARFPNKDQILKHGSTGKVVVKTLVKDAVTIPQKSTFEIQDHVYVYTVDGEGRARAKRIVPKIRLKDVFVVEFGIAAGERFIADGIQKVKDGAKIAVRAQTPQPSPAL
jgi:membrane fusion protein (multidrug efflux system)